MTGRGSTALALLAMTTVGACGDSPQMAAQRKVFNACQESVASKYPNTCGSGEVCVDVKHIQDVGAGMEQCMAGSAIRPRPPSNTKAQVGETQPPPRRIG